MVPDGARKKLCRKCGEAGRESKLRLYQIHINEAVLMCEDPECTFSLSTSRVVTRDFSSVKRLRHRLPVAYRSLPSSPALSHSSGSSGHGTELGCSRSSSPVSHAASDSFLLRHSRRNTDPDLLKQNGLGFAVPHRPCSNTNGFRQYERQDTQEFRASEEDDLSALLAGIEDVDFVCAPSSHPEPEPGQFSNALENLIDMDSQDNLDIPLDKGDCLGGGPARGQPGEPGSGDAMANGSGEQGMEVVVQRQGEVVEKVVEMQNVDQAVSSSTVGFDGTEPNSTPTESGDAAPMAVSAGMETEAVADGDAFTYAGAEESGGDYSSAQQAADPCTSSESLPAQSTVAFNAVEDYPVESSAPTQPEETEAAHADEDQYPVESSDQVSGGEEASMPAADAGQFTVESSTGFDGPETTCEAPADDGGAPSWEDTVHHQQGVQQSYSDADTVTTTVESGPAQAASVVHSEASYTVEEEQGFQYDEAAYETQGVSEPEDRVEDSGSQHAPVLEYDESTAAVEEPAESSSAFSMGESAIDPSSQLAAQVLSSMPHYAAEAAPQTSEDHFTVNTDQFVESSAHYSEEVMETSGVDGAVQSEESFTVSTSVEQFVNSGVEQYADTQHYADVSQSVDHQQEGTADQMAEAGGESVSRVDSETVTAQEVSSSEVDSTSAVPSEASEAAYPDNTGNVRAEESVEDMAQSVEDVDTSNLAQSGEGVETSDYQHVGESGQQEQMTYQMEQTEVGTEHEQTYQYVQSEEHEPLEGYQAEHPQEHTEAESYPSIQPGEGVQPEEYEVTHTGQEIESGYQYLESAEQGQPQQYQVVHTEESQGEEVTQPGEYIQQDYQVHTGGDVDLEQQVVEEPSTESHSDYHVTQSEDVQEESVETYQPMEYATSEDVPAQHDEAEQYVVRSDQAGTEISEETVEGEKTHYEQQVVTSEEFQMACEQELGEEQQVETSEEVVGETSMEVDTASGPADMLAAASEIAGVNQSEEAGTDVGAEAGSDSENEEFVPVAQIETRRVPAKESEEMEGGIKRLTVGGTTPVVTSQVSVVTTPSQTTYTLPASVVSQLQQVSGGQVLTGTTLTALLQRLQASVTQPQQTSQQQQLTTSLLQQHQPSQTATLLQQLPATTLMPQPQQTTASTVLQASSLLKQATAATLLPQQTTTGQAVGSVLPQQVATTQASSTSQSQTQQQLTTPDAPVTRILQDAETRATGQQVVNLYVQWQNVDALCWLDVLLCPLVHSPTLTALMTQQRLQELEGTILCTLIKAYRQAQAVLQALLNRAAQQEAQARADNPLHQSSTVPAVNIVNKNNIAEIGQAVGVLYTARENIWKTVQPRLRCEKGKHDSPVFAMPLLVRENPEMKRMFTMNYRLVFACTACGYTQDDKHQKIMPSLPSVPDDFGMEEPCFVRPCFHCQAPGQRMRMIFEGLHDFFLLHFVNGMPHNRFHELDFSFGGSDYMVTSVVQYKRNPDHFISWIRNAPDHSWMECDDLKSVLTRFMPGQPCIPPSQVHIVMWERNLAPSHGRRFINTPHTNLLASLVLTVQYPSAATPTTASTTTTAAAATQSPIQRIVYPSSNPRGRGRGGRGRGRGRGQIQHTTNIIRRPAVAPASKQTIYTIGSPTPQAPAPGGTNQRIVVLKSSTGGLQAVNPATLTPALLEALKKQGVNVGAIKGPLVLQQTSGGVSQPISLTSLLGKPAQASTITTMTPTSIVPAAEREASSEASEAAAALMSSMQEEVSVQTSTPSTTIQMHTQPTSVQFHTTTVPGATSLLGSGMVLPGQVLTPSGDSAGKTRSLLTNVLTSAPLEGQAEQPMVVKQVSASTSPTKVALGAQGGMYRIMSSGGKAIQVTPVSSGPQGRRVVMLTQSTTSSRGINIVHPQLTSTPATVTSTTTPMAKYQLMTKPDGTRILTQISPASASASPSAQPASSVRVALEGGEGGTRLVSISSPSRGQQSGGVDSFPASILSTTTSPSSMVGTPLHEARSSNIRTSIVDASNIRTSIVDAVVTNSGTTSTNPIVISPPTGGMGGKVRMVSVNSSGAQLAFTSLPQVVGRAGSSAVVTSPTSVVQAKSAGPLLDIRHHLTFRSETPPKTDVPKEPEVELEEDSENEADLDLVGLADDDWKIPSGVKQPAVQVKRGRGGRGGRSRGRGRGRGGRGRGGRGRGRGSPKDLLTPGGRMMQGNVLIDSPSGTRIVSITPGTAGIPAATFSPPHHLAAIDSQDNTDSSSSLAQETPASEVASEESVDIEMSDGGQIASGSQSPQKPSEMEDPGASVVTEAVQSFELGSGDNMYASSQAEQDQFENAETYEDTQDMSMEVVEQEVVTSSDMQVVEQEVTVGEEVEGVAYSEEVGQTHPPEIGELVQQTVEEVARATSPSIMGKRGRRRQSGGQSPRRGRKSSGSSPGQSPRGRRRVSDSVEEMSYVPLTESTEDVAASPTKASPRQSPFTSPARISPQKSPVASPTRESPTKSLLAFSPLKASPQKSPVSSPVRGSSPVKSPHASPARTSPVKSPYASPTQGQESPTKSPIQSPAYLQPSVTEMVTEETVEEEAVAVTDEGKLESSLDEVESEEQEETITMPPKKRGRARPYKGHRSRRGRGRGRGRGGSKGVKSPVYPPLADEDIAAVTTEASGSHTEEEEELEAPEVAPEKDFVESSSVDGETVEQVISVPSPTKSTEADTPDHPPTAEPMEAENVPSSQGEESEAAEEETKEQTPQTTKKRRGRPKKIRAQPVEDVSENKEVEVEPEASVSSAVETTKHVEEEVQESSSVVESKESSSVVESKESSSVVESKESSSVVESKESSSVVESKESEDVGTDTVQEHHMDVAEEPAVEQTMLETPPVTPATGKKRRGRPPKKASKRTAEPEADRAGVAEESVESAGDLAQPADTHAACEGQMETELASQAAGSDLVTEEPPASVETSGQQDSGETAVEEASSLDEEPSTSAAQDLPSPKSNTPSSRGRKGRRGRTPKQKVQESASVDETFAQAEEESVEAKTDIEVVSSELNTADQDIAEPTPAVEAETSTSAVDAQTTGTPVSAKKKGKRGRPPKVKETVPAEDSMAEVVDTPVEPEDGAEVSTVNIEDGASQESVAVKEESMDVLPKEEAPELPEETEMEVKPSVDSESPAIPKKKRGRPPKSAKKTSQSQKATKVENPEVDVHKFEAEAELENVETLDEKPAMDGDASELKHEEVQSPTDGVPSPKKQGGRKKQRNSLENVETIDEKPDMDGDAPELKLEELQSSKDGAASPKKQRGRKRQRNSLKVDTPVKSEFVPAISEVEKSPAVGPRSESRSSKDRDNIFDIMSSVSPSKEDKSPAANTKTKKVKMGKESPRIKSPKSTGKNAKLTSASPEHAVVKRRSYVSATPALTDFPTPSGSGVRGSEKRNSMHNRSGSEEAVVIRRRPRPLASPDVGAPPLPSHISPSRPIGHADYSEGYQAVLIKRRRTADWSATHDQLDRDAARLSRFEGPSTSAVAGTSNSGHSHSDYLDTGASDFLHESSQALAVESAEVSNGSAKTVHAQFSPVGKKSVKGVSGKKSRTKVRAGDSRDSLEEVVRENHSDGMAGPETDAKYLNADTPLKQESVSADIDETDSFTTPVTDSMPSSSGPVSDLKSESSSSIRRSSRPVVPSQRLKESNILKRRLSGADSGETSKKKNRTVQ